MTSNIKKYILSDYNVICDVCGKLRKRSQTTLAYATGDIPVIVSCLDGCADYRHPLNSPPPVIFDGRPVPYARPEGTDAYISVTVPSGLTWGHFINAGTWGNFNFPNTDINLNGVWTWGNFHRR